jgi:hypothetical protein
MIDPVSIQQPVGTYASAQRPTDIPHAPAPVQQEVQDQTAAGIRQKKALFKGDCNTCANRRYQDKSSDPGVSFKAPTKLTPNEAASQVVAHEREHVARDTAKAREEGREVVHSSINITTANCPECGRMYVSGGSAKTVTRAKEADMKDPLNTAGTLMDLLA